MSQEGEAADRHLVDLSAWRQGDYVLDGCGFFQLVSGETEESPIDQAFDEGCVGLVVISQTCDIVGSDANVVLAPLVEVDEKSIAYIKGGRTPQFALLEHPPGDNIVVDLSRMMTVDKALLANWTRTEGFTNEEALRKFAYALERKLGRFAFPDEFVAAIKKFHDAVREKHGKDSDLGKTLRSLVEIRVRAAPNWNANPAEVLFYFIVDPETDSKQREAMATELDKLLAKIDLPSSYRWPAEAKKRVASLDDLTARDYAESVPLDYYALTIAK